MSKYIFIFLFALALAPQTRASTKQPNNPKESINDTIIKDRKREYQQAVKPGLRELLRSDQESDLRQAQNKLHNAASLRQEIIDTRKESIEESKGLTKLKNKILLQKEKRDLRRTVKKQDKVWDNIQGARNMHQATTEGSTEKRNKQKEKLIQSSESPKRTSGVRQDSVRSLSEPAPRSPKEY